MLDLATEPVGIPRKVLSTAITFGVHVDCIIGGEDTSCLFCRRIMRLSLDMHYSHLAGSEAKLSAIRADILADRDEE